MSDFTIGIVLALVVIVFCLIGIEYVRTTKKSIRDDTEAFNKQEYVKQNRSKFGVENRGTSMDGRKIFTVSPSDLGL